MADVSTLQRSARFETIAHSGDYGTTRRSEIKRSAVDSASAAGTFTSAATPVPSQFVFEYGLIALANGTPMAK